MVKAFISTNIMRRENFIKALVQELVSHKFAVVPDVFKDDFVTAANKTGLDPVDEVYLKPGDYPNYPLGGYGFSIE